jgi:monofunctional biosynthetic peptidoglycan transglycosylase
MSSWKSSWWHLPVSWLARIGTILRWTVRLLLLFLVLDLFYLAINWPDWKSLANGPIPKTAFMLDYEREHGQNGKPARLQWRPVPLSSIPKHMQRAVIVAEDSRFYEHSGFDLAAFKEAMDYNFAEGRLAMGASTISQQTVKNLFLSSARTPLRKWHELILTWGMERSLSKRRIMELYLNIAQFGPGIYGVQAASQTYWGTGISDINARQAAELAATLPSPTKNNPGTRTRQFARRASRIMHLLIRFPGDAAPAVVDYREEPELAEPSQEASGDMGSTAECEDDECPTETVEQPDPATPEIGSESAAPVDPALIGPV